MTSTKHEHSVGCKTCIGIDDESSITFEGLRNLMQSKFNSQRVLAVDILGLIVGNTTDIPRYAEMVVFLLKEFNVVFYLRHLLDDKNVNCRVRSLQVLNVLLDEIPEVKTI